MRLALMSLWMIPLVVGCGGDKDSGDTDSGDTGLAPGGWTVDCAAITKVVHSWGGTTGPCGPVTTVEVDTAGNVSTAHTDAYPPDGETDCETVTSSHTIDDPTALFALVCDDFNDGFDPIEDCGQGSFERIGLYVGDDLIISSGDCIPTGLEAAQAALQAVSD